MRRDLSEMPHLGLGRLDPADQLRAVEGACAADGSDETGDPERGHCEEALTDPQMSGIPSHVHH